MKRVAVLQSNYVPWKGYFELLASVDEFILYEDAQFTNRDWRNRNRIKTPNGLSWLTVPVQTKGLSRQAIRDVRISDSDWQSHHWKQLEWNYRKSLAFEDVSDFVKGLYLNANTENLSVLNRTFIEQISCFLGLETRLTTSGEYSLISDDRTEKLISLCKGAGASVYVTGPKARAYLDEAKFHEAGLEVEWFSYGPYREYPQLFGTFVHEVSILDLLLNCGVDSREYLRAERK